ncbi:MAG TPA: type II toxin-antitoxin system RelE/ParE family toxin [Pyrinomonadaceae bacterium]|nr:type II toxin-antitoxin system RelE/ParE family toxin [Pyrinomonadaceae bacterium]
MKQYLLQAEAAVEFDVESAFQWYETEEPGLGFEFLKQLRSCYETLLRAPYGYQELRSGIRRALTKRFPYAVYFSIEDEVVVVLAVLHIARDPAEWQRRI